eukprot:gene315-33549_t
MFGGKDPLLGDWWHGEDTEEFMQVDPSKANRIYFSQIGDDMLVKLRRPFWTELQSRYGNQFFVRDEGELAAVIGTIDAVTTCLDRPQGCAVVPGIPDEQYVFTLALSISGGLVAGSVIGPIITRTDDPTLIVYNTIGFLAAVALASVLPSMGWATEKKGGDF